MCNLSEDVFQRGVDQGREEGRAKFLTAASLVRDGVLALREAADRFGFSESGLRSALLAQP